MKNKNEILEHAKAWMRDELVVGHIRNTEKLAKLNSFNINPFLWQYLANFLDGEISAESLAKALILPRVLGSSITTSFGTRAQDFIIKAFPGIAKPSLVQGMDIEFIDQVDGRNKYCQVKAGPNVINKDDVDTISRHFDGLFSLARTNHLSIQQDDAVFALLYGKENEKSIFIRKVEEKYVVREGEDFWYHLTGDENFYFDLIKAMSNVAIEANANEVLSDTIAKLVEDIREKYPELK